MKEHNFKSFVKILISLVKWVFIFDHHNYVRWLFVVHIQDLMSVPITCPQLYQEFERGNFVAEISGRQFAQIHYDQAHEQSNKTIKYIKGPIEFVNWASDELTAGGRSQGPKLPNFKGKSRAEYSKVTTKMTPNALRIILHTMLCLGKITLP